jgi:hypothetical protein
MSEDARRFQQPELPSISAMIRIRLNRPLNYLALSAGIAIRFELRCPVMQNQSRYGQFPVKLTDPLQHRRV